MTQRQVCTERERGDCRGRHQSPVAALVQEQPSVVGVQGVDDQPPLQERAEQNSQNEENIRTAALGDTHVQLVREQGEPRRRSPERAVQGARRARRRLRGGGQGSLHVDSESLHSGRTDQLISKRRRRILVFCFLLLLLLFIC